MLELRIAELRERRGLTQEDLAEKIGTTKQQMGRLENGKRPLSNHWIEKIAHALAVRPGELFNEMPRDLAPNARALVDHFQHLPPAQQEALVQLAGSMAHRDPLTEIFERLPDSQRGALLQLAESMTQPHQPGEVGAPKRLATGTD